MQKPIDHYWSRRLKDLKAALEKNCFQVFIADNASEARRIAVEEIIPSLNPKTVSWGGSMTMLATGIYDELKTNGDFEILDTLDRKLPPNEFAQLRRKSLLSDLFITGSNAVTEDGQLVNLDMLGNRVGGITFGPRNVLLFIGRNKLVPDIETAMERIKNYAAPVNAMRLDKKTPCVQTAYCQECKSPERICNTWVITEKSFPEGRVKIVLINDDLGL